MENVTTVIKDDKQFQKEQDQLLQTLLNYRFFYPWKGLEENAGTPCALCSESKLELFITSECNQKCEYCYLHNNHQIYPVEFLDHNTILQNLKILYDYILSNNFHLPELDLFSGEIWHTKFGLDILDLTTEYIKNGMYVERIVIASNCSFVMNDEYLQQIQQRIDTLKITTNTNIEFSVSVDGAIIDNIERKRNNDKEYTDEFYDKVFTFAKFNGYLFHPMIASKTVHLWKENFEWWKKKLKEYNIEGYILDDIMTLEVRNNDWTEETIKSYCEFLEYLMEDFLVNHCDNDIEKYGNILASIRRFTRDNTFMHGGYIPWTINKVDKIMGCTVVTDLTVRLGDLAICPCHRLAYDSYLYGKFKVENGKITGVTAQNPQMAIKILMGNVITTSPVCNRCYLNEYCQRGCFGSQLESMKDPFFPIPCVCELFKEKIHTILNFLRKKGIINYLKSVSVQEINSNFVMNILKIEQLEKEMYHNELGAY